MNNFTRSVKEIIKDLPEPLQNQVFRNMLSKFLRKEYYRGYKKGLQENDLKYVILKENSTTTALAEDSRIHRDIITPGHFELLKNYVEVIGFDVFKINPSDYLPTYQRREIADFHKCLYFIFNECGMNKSAIGRRFSKNHSTVVTAIKTFNTILNTDQSFFTKFAVMVDRIEKMLNEKGLRLPISILIKAKIYNSNIAYRQV